ncbi:tripartite tricarboxylate transporter TctB family protein [Pseudonocardia kunmingensis]|uniref:Tripartite tricarboxylate transporter TctB family protein n=1 Tax=Pseudonocardia kunmingensis TaxID=630975 RepID=A0A543DVF1_9PSEU|nr:tripartite tricarboxylate transporter TctB family protein [Pseudonocardia kunmingensis]TQM13301.1 tripartite tricarboxylate transporter TctB family protein [Pseudonocardia kunmingensis]
MRDIILGIAFVVMGLLIVGTTHDYPPAASLAADPALFPRAIGVALGALGVLIAVAGLWARRSQERDDPRAPDATGEQAAPAAPGADTPDTADAPIGMTQVLRRVAPFVAAAVVYVWVAFSSGLGYATSTFLFLTILIIWLSPKRNTASYASAAALSGAISAALYATFVFALAVPIPPGILP